MNAGGDIQYWGYSTTGQLGINSNINQNTAVKMLNSSGTTSNLGIQNIAVGGYFSCILINGQIQCTGLNSNGELGNFSTENTSLPVTSIGF